MLRLFPQGGPDIFPGFPRPTHNLGSGLFMCAIAPRTQKNTSAGIPDLRLLLGANRSWFMRTVFLPNLFPRTKHPFPLLLRTRHAFSRLRRLRAGGNPCYPFFFLEPLIRGGTTLNPGEFLVLGALLRSTLQKFFS